MGVFRFTMRVAGNHHFISSYLRQTPGGAVVCPLCLGKAKGSHIMKPIGFYWITVGKDSVRRANLCMALVEHLTWSLIMLHGRSFMFSLCYPVSCPP